MRGTEEEIELRYNSWTQFLDTQEMRLRAKGDESLKEERNDEQKQLQAKSGMRKMIVCWDSLSFLTLLTTERLVIIAHDILNV